MMEQETKKKLMIGLLFGFFGLLMCVGMFAAAWWGSYVSCNDGGGHLHYSIPFVEYQCIGFYVENDPRLIGTPAFDTTNLTPTFNITWGNDS